MSHIEVDGGLVGQEILGMMSVSELSKKNEVYADGILANVIASVGTGARGIMEIELYDSLGNLVASVGPQKVGTVNLNLNLTPVAAGLEGDNGSTNTIINYKVDPVSFANCKIKISFHGSYKTVCRVRIFPSDAPFGTLSYDSYTGDGSGNGVVIFEIPFRVVD